MMGVYTYFRDPKPIVGVAMGGFMLGTLFCKIDGAAARECDLFAKSVWAGLEVLRSVMLLADWQAVSGSLCQDSWFLGHLLQIGTSIWPLLCAMAG